MQKYSEAKKPLNKPFRTSGGPKKFAVYVKDPESGNVKIVRFGDPNMEIKRDDPDRKKSFRARHNCDQKKDKTTAGYWSCKMWSKTPVGSITKSSNMTPFALLDGTFHKRANDDGNSAAEIGGGVAGGLAGGALGTAGLVALIRANRRRGFRTGPKPGHFAPALGLAQLISGLSAVPAGVGAGVGLGSAAGRQLSGGSGEGGFRDALGGAAGAYAGGAAGLGALSQIDRLPRKLQGYGVLAALLGAPLAGAASGVAVSRDLRDA
jgi:hypothetical protein